MSEFASEGRREKGQEEVSWFKVQLQYSHEGALLYHFCHT